MKQDAKRAEALANVCNLMRERYGRELGERTAAQLRREATLCELERSVVAVSGIHPQSAVVGLRRMADLGEEIRRGAIEIACLRRHIVTWTARRDMLSSRASAMRSLLERRGLERESLDGLRAGKSEASS